MTITPTLHHLDVPGARLHYEVRGTGPLLLAVGQPMTSGPFAPLAHRLAGDRTVVTYDPRGVGRSEVGDPTRDVTPEIEADDLSRLIATLGGGPAEVFGTSGGAVAGLALATAHPEQVSVLVAHEPPLAELLPDAAEIRTAVDRVQEAYRTAGAGAGWGAFISLVMHRGPVPADGVADVSWPPPGADAGPPPPPDPRQEAADALFFLRMLRPFTRYRPDVEALRTAGPRILVAVGDASGEEIAGRATRALADLLGAAPVPLPGHHAGFTEDPDGFAEGLRRLLPG